MFVRQLIGRNAGQIVDMPYTAATSNIDMGTCAAVTDAEIAAAGLMPPDVVAQPLPEEMPLGFKAIETPGGGYDVVLNGNVLNDLHIPNRAAARSFAQAYAEQNPVAAEPEPEIVPEPEPVAPVVEPEPVAVVDTKHTSQAKK